MTTTFHSPLYPALRVNIDGGSFKAIAGKMEVPDEHAAAVALWAKQRPHMGLELAGKVRPEADMDMSKDELVAMAVERGTDAAEAKKLHKDQLVELLNAPPVNGEANADADAGTDTPDGAEGSPDLTEAAPGEAEGA